MTTPIKTNNTFQDEHLGIEFIIPYHRFLKPAEAQKVARHLIKQEQDALFEVWKSKPANREWKGDVAAKKEELFLNNHRDKAPIVVFGLGVEAALKESPPSNA